MLHVNKIAVKNKTKQRVLIFNGENSIVPQNKILTHVYPTKTCLRPAFQYFDLLHLQNHEANFNQSWHKTPWNPETRFSLEYLIYILYKNR